VLGESGRVGTDVTTAACTRTASVDAARGATGRGPKPTSSAVNTAATRATRRVSAVDAPVRTRMASQFALLVLLGTGSRRREQAELAWGLDRVPSCADTESPIDRRDL